VGLVTFADEIHRYVPPRRHRSQMHQIVVGLESEPPSARTDMRKSLSNLVPALKKRGLVVLFSDLLDDPEAVAEEVAYLRSCGHDIVIFEILDPAEARWTFDQNAVFEDMETGERFQLDPARVSEHYLQQMSEHQAVLQKLCSGLAMDLVQVTTDQPFDEPLHHLLSLRSRLDRRRRGA
jgi:uncharacterized protein (DUF58 family)